MTTIDDSDAAKGDENGDDVSIKFEGLSEVQVEQLLDVWREYGILLRNVEIYIDGDYFDYEREI